MSFKSKFISAITLTLATVAFTTFVSAQETPKQEDSIQKQERQQRNREFGGKRGGFGEKRHGGNRGDRMLMGALQKLNLSDAQKEQTRSIFENFKNSTETQRTEMRDLGMKKRDGIISAEEEARFRQIKTQLKTSGEQMNDSILAVLTAEQRTQLDQMKNEMKQKMQERRQNRQNRQTPTSQDN